MNEYFEEQLKHIPTKEMFDTIHLIAKKQKYQNALEIGVAWAISTIAILSAGEGRLRSVDKSKYQNTIDQVNDLGYQSRWEYIIQDSLTWLSGDKDEYDLICIDGSHYYDDVYTDLLRSISLLNKKGVIIIDDYLHRYNKDGDYGVTKAVDELVKTYNLSIKIHHKANGIAELRFKE